jgi:K+-transporting ATPase ATPase C chain
MENNNTALFRPALALLGLLTLLTGVVYPLAVWGIGQTLFTRQANGSLVEANGRVVGSELVAQRFDGPEWFWPRPSAVGYDASSSGGSNLATTNPALLEAVKERVAALRAADPGAANLPVPVDLVTASGSGLDPDITPASALYQASRVATARGLKVQAVERLVAEQTTGRTFGLLGEPRVNVLRLNMALLENSRRE